MPSNEDARVAGVVSSPEKFSAPKSSAPTTAPDNAPDACSTNAAGNDDVDSGAAGNDGVVIVKICVSGEFVSGARGIPDPTPLAVGISPPLLPTPTALWVGRGTGFLGLPGGRLSLGGSTIPRGVLML